VSGGYVINGNRERYQAFAEGLTIRALNMEYFRFIGAKVTDNRTARPQYPSPQFNVNEATEPEVEAAIAAEIYQSTVYPVKGE
jgi:hypothetical protein